MAGKIMMVNVLLTRRCNLRCEYCDIVRDYEGRPVEYPKVETIKDRTAEEWIADFEVLRELYKDKKDLFFILYGGEPFLFHGLTKIIMYFGEHDLNYTIITNGTLVGIVEQVKDLGIRGLSCSVDPLTFEENKDRDKKAWNGFNLLSVVKKEIPNCDCTAEIVVDNDNVTGLIPLVKKLSDKGVWSSITIAERKKNKYYDFASNSEKSKADSVTVREKFEMIFNMAESKMVKVHVPKILKWLSSIMPMESRDCGLLENSMTIEPDGCLRLCLRIRGVETPRFKVKALGEKLFSVCAAQEEDFTNYCEGCAWTCPQMPQLSKEHEEITHKEVKVV